MFLVNGIAITTIEVADRSCQYGDGLFETLKIIEKSPVFLKQHWQRLQDGCEKLLLPAPELPLFLTEINQVCQSASSSPAVLKLIVTRGVGGRGYRQPNPIQTNRILSLHPFPDYPDSYRQDGVMVRICQTRLGISPALAGIKHLNRLEQVLARAEWTDMSFQEGIMLNANDWVIEGTMSNLFYIKENILYTASLKHSGVAGVMRRLVMELCQQHYLAVVEHDYTLAELMDADEIFLTNAIIGIWPVKQIEGNSFSVGSITQQIQHWLSQLQTTSQGFEI